MQEGFILLYRKIRLNWIYKRSDYYHWFTEFVFLANFKDNDNYLFEGDFIKIKRGQFVTSNRKLAKNLPNCSEQKIRTFIKLLIKDKIVLIENLKKATRITICNYDSYQGEQHSSNTTATQHKNTIPTNKFVRELEILNSVYDLFDFEIISALNENQKNDWLDTINKLHRIDGFGYPEIEETIIWGRNDDFWQSNFLSILGLRKKKNGISKFFQINKKMNYGQSGKQSKDSFEELCRTIRSENPEL